MLEPNHQNYDGADRHSNTGKTGHNEQYIAGLAETVSVERGRFCKGLAVAVVDCITGLMGLVVFASEQFAENDCVGSGGVEETNGNLRDHHDRMQSFHFQRVRFLVVPVYVFAKYVENSQ